MTQQGVGVVRPLPGDGVVAHLGGLLVVSTAAPPIDDLLAALRATATTGGDGRALARRVAQILARTMDRSTTGEPVTCAVAGPAAGGIAVLVSGDAFATVSGGPDGEVRLAGRDALTWTDRLVAGPVTRVELRLPHAGSAGPYARLDAGVVDGAGLDWDLTHSTEPVSAPLALVPQNQHHGGQQAQVGAPEPIAARAPVVPPNLPPVTGSGPAPDLAAPPPEGLRPAEEEPVSGDPEEATQVDTAPPPEPRPMVYGVDCVNDHFNDPRAAFCAICGTNIDQRAVVPYKGPRPTLGVLVLDDGVSLPLDGDYVLGRDPERAVEVQSGAARPAKVTSPDGSVSRRHLRVGLQGWDVNLVDLGSVNGTQIQPPGDPNFYDIPPNEPVPIQPGTTVRIGVSRTMRYEAHRTV